ncbi:MAG: hypothetical protein KGM24_04945 [Elusimicrobia bacterium]|nr:hypothetical protein [Elusimicrobiota bacterium]
MKTLRRALLPAAAILASACAAWRWSGSPPPDGRPATAALHRNDQDARPAPRPPQAAAQIELSTTPARPPAAVEVPPTPKARLEHALFYSDLGPDAIDVSGYPAQQRYEYGVFVRACSACHTLARAINAPYASRGWWEFYMLGMRMRSRWQGRPLTREESKAVLDFLEYDSRVRKVENAREFDALTEVLKKRFDASVAERMGRLQKGRQVRP